MILLFDIGNTRIKWAVADERGLGEQYAAAHADWDAGAFARIVLDRSPRPARVLISNVGGQRIGELLRAGIHERWQIQPEFVASTAAACGVRNAYPVPGNLGVDRWLGVIAAYQRSRQLTCIVGVGTAMTIDGVDASGQHLGGLIVPGPDLMVSSLLRNTSDIARRAEQGSRSDALFADNTQGAIYQGAAHALAALVDRSVDAMSREHGVQPALLLTGGAASAIERLIRAPFESVPDLVLQGLCLWGRLEPA
ncbi:MAG TPA: type III pantothenate kinase [Povalibacter sp.]|uniref:type III pantothenate kinase n=1 Tax=Povalibacter sp. TaxID=1962978 RepID=UPI002C8520A3|nr:type III pantothenate kinase [Povalibacter sp.]HMN43600.1 type III pantothenate kinase [Povalibacter sp.]